MGESEARRTAGHTFRIFIHTDDQESFCSAPWETSIFPELTADRTPALLSDSQIPHLTLSLNLGQLQIVTHLIPVIKEKAKGQISMGLIPLQTRKSFFVHIVTRCSSEDCWVLSMKAEKRSKIKSTRAHMF